MYLDVLPWTPGEKLLSPTAKQGEGEGFTLALLGLVHSELTSFIRPHLSFLQSLYKHTFSKQCLMRPSFSSRGLREKEPQRRVWEGMRETQEH